MKFTINREEFLKGLLNTSRFIPSKNLDATIVLIKITLNEDGLYLVGSNGDLDIQSFIPNFINDVEVISNQEYGGILTNPRLLTEIIRKIEGQIVTFEVIDNVIHIENNKSNFKLVGQDENEYRELTFDRNGVGFTLASKDFLNAINEVSFSASLKDSRPILTAINLECTGNDIIFTATDGARLSKKTISIDVSEVFNINVSSKALVEISKLITTEKEIEVYVSSKKILFYLNNIIVSSKFIVGDYPNTKNIIPSKFYYYLEVNSQEFLDAIDRTTVFSIERENIVKLTMTSDRVEISSKSNTFGSAIERINLAKFSGDRLEISFNSEYVVNAIRALKSESITLSFIGEMKPFTITNKDDDSIIQLVTPVRTY